MTKEAMNMRLSVLDMALAAGSGHIGGSFSAMEILKVLYETQMRVRPDEPSWQGRDRLILSKGHAAPALYINLARKGFFDPAELIHLRELGHFLQGHPCMFKCPGVDMSTGSLGMGLSAGVGMALSLRSEQPDAHVYVILGDGELQEGQNYEAMMALRSFDLTNITPILDCNGVQLDGTNEEIQPNQLPLTQRLAGFGLLVLETDGHDEEQLCKTLEEARACGKPHIVVAHTVKGKGVSFMEGKSAWHGKPISKEEYEAACAELKGGVTL